jgi:PAS domain S-box-containing protein
MNTLLDNIESLSKSTELLKILDENLIVSKTDTKGIITFASGGFCNISGYSQNELVGQPHNIVRSPNMPKELFEDLWNTITKGEIWRGEIQNKTKTGEYYWIYATIVCEKDSGGKIVGYNAIRENITDKKKIIEFNKSLEQTIKEEVEKNILKDKQLIAQTKAAQMGEMMDAVAHQWKQPLTSISFVAQALDYHIEEEGEVSSAEVANATSVIHQQINHLLDTIDTFRNFFRADETLQKISFEEIITTVKGIMSSILNSHYIDIEIKGDETIAIPCIKSEFIHILINLINNAKDEFSRHNIAIKKIIFEIYKSEDGIVNLSVTDNGGGIPENFLDKVFEQHFTSKGNEAGTGVGLYISMQILKKLNGSMIVKNVETEYGRGAQFIITI